MARKKGSGEGSIYKTEFGWRGQLKIQGRRISVSGKTKTDVINKLAEARTDHRYGIYVFSDDITVKEYFEKWFERDKRPHLSEQTAIRYMSYFNNHIIPYFGDMKIQGITKDILEEGYATIFHQKKSKSSSGKNIRYTEKYYSHETVNSISVQMKQMLSAAVSDRIILRNPHEGVHLHKLRPPKKIDAYSVEDHTKIVEFTQQNQQDWIFYFLICTGMRFGEAVALTWEDVDIKAKTININKTSVELHGSPTIQSHTKTRSGKRIISITDTLCGFLRDVIASQSKDLNYRNLVLPNSRYNIRNSANTSVRWKKICGIMGIEYKGKHALRHTWATRALEAGINVKVVSSMLGHKNVITTMNIYQDALLPSQNEAAAKLDKFC